MLSSLAALLAVTPMATPPMDMPLSAKMYGNTWELNNRVLIKIQGSPISVMDVVRKMDLFMYRQCPDLMSQPTVRYEMYKENWRAFLQRTIDDRLVLADAEEKKIEVTDGEVREQMEKSLGPDVVFTIETLGLNFDEAWDLVKTELVVHKMQGMMAHARAFAEVTPRRIKERYEQLLKENPPEQRWIYQVLSLKGEEGEELSKSAKEAYALLVQEKLSLESVPAYFPALIVSLSPVYTRSEKEISQAHRAAVEGLRQGAFSSPVIKGGVAHIFYLQESEKVMPPSLAESANELKQQMLQELMMRYDQEYRERLRTRYGLTPQFLSQLIPRETTPFVLR